MALKILTPPAIEPLTLDEVRLHLRLDSGIFANDISTVQSIILGSHAVAATYSLQGVPVDIEVILWWCDLSSGPTEPVGR